MTEKGFRRIGLTGGVGSGKTTAAEYLRRAGLPVIDLDKLGRDLLSSDKELIARIGEICGGDVVKAGALDKLAVRQLIFSNPEMRSRLEKLLHPKVWAMFEGQTKEHQRQGKTLVICEAALLVEASVFKKLDGLVVVVSPDSIRKERVVKRDAIDESLVELMMKSQSDDKEKLGHATDILYNDDRPEKLEAQVLTLIAKWKKKGWI